MPKNLIIDFYAVNVSGQDSIDKAMTELQALPEDETRNMEFRDAPIRLARLSKHHGGWEGDLMKIRLGEAAVIASLNGKIEPVGIDNDTGLGETTAFLYDRSLNVFVIQRNRTAVSAVKAASYFQTLGKMDNALIFEPLLRLETYEMLASMKNITRFHIKVAEPADLGEIANDVPTLSGALGVAADFQSPTLELVLSMGKRKGSLKKSPLHNTVKKLMRFWSRDNEIVKKIVVSDKYDDDGHTDVLDLIEERLHMTLPVVVSPMPDEFYHRRRDVLRAAIDEKRSEIRRIVKSM